MKILIIEPDEYYHRQFRDQVEDIAELFFSRDVAGAQDVIDAQPLDLVVSELIFPDGHAYELLPKIQHIPFIVYTKVSHLEDVRQSMNLGARAYFVKGQDTLSDIKKFALAFSPEILNSKI